jgi:NADH dehydrogenase
MNSIKINIPEGDRKRIVIVGGGFAGLSLARRLAKLAYQVVLIDRNNYHQFQPLFYQVAMSGLEPSSIVFPFRKLFQRQKNVFLRVTEVTEVQADRKRIITPLGYCNYDYLVLAMGADTNFFGNERIERLSLPMKSVSEALYLRNTILSDFEKALVTTDYNERQGLVDIVVVGGGPTGVELSGSLAEMRNNILPKDYPELRVGEEMDIYLIQGAPQLLNGMSEEASQKSQQYLEDMGVKILLNTRVTDFDGEYVYMSDGQSIRCRKVIWAAGIKANTLPGIPETAITHGGRLAVDRYNQVAAMEGIFAIGDLAYMEEPDFPKGHPQVAQTAIQQGKHLAKNLKRELKGQPWEEFTYLDKGSMATVGRARAVVDLPKGLFFGGFLAWFVWLAVHLFAILGTKNKLFVFLNWVWNYASYDQSLRLIIRPHATSGAPAQTPLSAPAAENENS